MLRKEPVINYTNNFWRAFDFKILADYERAKMFVHDGKIPQPRFSNMYITSFCNQNCRYCEYSLENKKGIIMPTKMVLKNIDEVYALGVRAIDFCGGGEPLLHPDSGKILNYARKKKIALGLFTNLAFRNDKILKTIVNSCSYIRISLDTFDEKNYNLIRRPCSPNESFRVVIKNIRKLVKLKKRYDSDIIIGTKMLINRFNYKEIEDFIKQSIKIGADNIQFKKVSLSKDLYISPRIHRSIEDEFVKLKTKYGNAIDILQNCQDSKLKIRCFMHVNHIFIDAFGDVYLCCYYLRRKKKHKLGNIYEKSIKDIWFSRRHWEVARHTQIKECNRMDCRWIKFNNLMKDFIYDDKLRQLDFV